ncbi:MAG: hypothetical protein AAF865_01100 [Pseudomonadota bacterium]
MNTENAALANEELRSAFDYRFGTFNERLDHLCALFEAEPPEIAYEDGRPLLTDPLADWMKENHANWDWLFMGSPSGLLRAWVQARGEERQFIDLTQKLEPELRNGLLALMRAVVEHDLPIEEPLRIFDQVMKDWRAKRGEGDHIPANEPFRA